MTSTHTDNPAPRVLPRFLSGAAIVRAFLLAALSLWLLLWSRPGTTQSLDSWPPLRLVLVFVGLALATLLGMWGLWSWPRIRMRCEGTGGAAIFRVGVLTWGGAMLIASSVQETLRFSGVTMSAELQDPHFAVGVLSRALVTWPIYMWGGYWFGYLTVGALRWVLR